MTHMKKYNVMAVLDNEIAKKKIYFFNKVQIDREIALLRLDGTVLKIQQYFEPAAIQRTLKALSTSVIT